MDQHKFEKPEYVKVGTPTSEDELEAHANVVMLTFPQSGGLNLHYADGGVFGYAPGKWSHYFVDDEA